MRIEDEVAKCPACKLEFIRTPWDPDHCPECGCTDAPRYAAVPYVMPLLFSDWPAALSKPAIWELTYDYNGCLQNTRQSWFNATITIHKNDANIRPLKTSRRLD